jgi:Zn-dependent peptidase ImmA (M78 family)
MPSYEGLIQALISGDRSGAAQPPSSDELAAAMNLAERYARIEKKVLGATKVAFSPTSLQVEAHKQDDALALGEFIATSERARLELPAGPILELVRVVEEQGVKVLPRRFPEEYSGGFFFDDKLGPCILVQMDTNDSALQYALAHQYAHFMADYDPYITTLCGWPSAAILKDPVELRAHHAALALLMPRADLELYRDAFGASETLQPELLQQLHVYFELDPEQILWRLLTLGWIDAPGLDQLLHDSPQLAVTLRSPPPMKNEDTLLPERFVRLVASAFGSGKLDIEAAARFLGTDLDGAEGILSQFEYESPTTKSKSVSGAAPKRGGDGNGSARARS